MPNATYVPSRIGEGHFTDFQPPAAGATDNGKVWAWNSTTSKFEPITPSGGTPGGSDTQIQYNNAGVLAGAAGITRTGSGILSLSTALVSPIIRPASDSTAAVKITNAAGTSDVVVVDTTNSKLYVPNPSSSTRTYIGQDGIYITTNSGTSVNSFVMSSLDTIIASRSNLIAKSNGTTWLTGSSTSLAFTSSSISFSDGSGSINLIGSTLRGGNNLLLQALDNRFTVTVKQNSNASGTADIFRIQTQASAAALYVDTSGNVAIGQSSASSKLDVAGTVQMDGLRVDVTPTAETVTCTHTITFSANGTNYKIPCVAA